MLPLSPPFKSLPPPHLGAHDNLIKQVREVEVVQQRPQPRIKVGHHGQQDTVFPEPLQR